MKNELINKSDVQNVIIKLDKNKPRELKFRMYLDSKRREGMSMKEAILQLFEGKIDSDKFQQEYGQNLIITHSPEYEVKNLENKIKTTEQKEDVSEDDFDFI